jgi:type 1 glutamine amidotransferase
MQVLVFSRTTGYRHDSIPAAVRAIGELGSEGGFAVTATEDPAVFTADALAAHRVVVFLSTTGRVLDDAQRAAFEEYIRTGGGFVGVHSASATETDWPFFGELLGAVFAGHPEVQPGDVVVTDRTHPATAHLPERWHRVDEWYEFRGRPAPSVRVLATVDESSYSGGRTGADHPHAWCQTYAGARSFYTAGGHAEAAYAEPAFRAHLLGGIRWAAGTD